MKEKLITLFLFTMLFALSLNTSVIYAYTIDNSNKNINTVYTNNSTNFESTNTTSDNSYSNANNSFEIKNLVLRSMLWGFIIATISCAFIWLKHKPVHIARNANTYLDSKSIHITNSYDHFINSNLIKKDLYKNN